MAMAGRWPGFDEGTIDPSLLTIGAWADTNAAPTTDSQARPFDSNAEQSLDQNDSRRAVDAQSSGSSLLIPTLAEPSITPRPHPDFQNQESTQSNGQDPDRPRLGLCTKLPTSGQPAPQLGNHSPLSAPAIQVYDTDAAFEAASAVLQSRRPRRNTSPRLQHQPCSAPAATPTNSLSPSTRFDQTTRQWVLHGGTYHPGTPAAQSDSVGVSSGSSPPRSRRRQRSSSRESSVSLTCNHCRKTFDTRSKYSHHIRYQTPQGDRKHVCDVCSKRFLFLKDLTRHQKVHTNTTTQCPECGQSIRGDRLDNLSRHRKTHSGQDGTLSRSSSVPPSTVGSSARLPRRPHRRSRASDASTPLTGCLSAPPSPSIRASSSPPASIVSGHLEDGVDELCLDSAPVVPGSSALPEQRGW